MHARELIGKKAIRTGPVDYGNGRKDFSYTTDGLFILAVTGSHIVYEHCDSFLEGKRSILDNRWLDENWGDYDELMRLADETKTDCKIHSLSLVQREYQPEIEQPESRDIDHSPESDETPQVVHDKEVSDEGDKL
ncbi:MAG: hypothetical protein Q8911_00265 [Bacillota bacterium]|nr:hypothetical protein [Bacillota bacterium]